MTPVGGIAVAIDRLERIGSAQVRADAEFIASSGDDDDPHRVVGIELSEDLVELRGHRGRPRVAAIGAFQNDGGNTVIVVTLDLGEAIRGSHLTFPRFPSDHHVKQIIK